MNNTKVRIRRGSRLLCPDCGTVQTLEFQNEKGEVFLVCGHHRTPRLLGPAPGHISLEHVIAGDPLALSLFPAIDCDGFKQRGRDIADVIVGIEMQAVREQWAA